MPICRQQPLPSKSSGLTRRSRGATLLAVLVTSLGSVALPSAANAEGRPVGDCPPTFRTQAISEFSAGTQAFLRSSIDRNGDEQVCTRDLPEAVPFLPINFIDNVAQT